MANSGYVVIQGDQARKLEMDGDKLVAGFTKEFQIDGKDSGQSAILILMVKGLVGDAEPIDVAINGASIGKIYPDKNGDVETWRTQILHFSASEGSLKPNAKSEETTNTIAIPADGSKPSFAKVYIQNLVCFYKLAD